MQQQPAPLMSMGMNKCRCLALDMGPSINVRGPVASCGGEKRLLNSAYENCH
jgi:hypothetical protein